MFRALVPISVLLFACNEPEKIQGLSLTENYQGSSLTESAEEAVSNSPLWLQKELLLALSTQTEERQDALSDQILNLEDPRLIDEVAFSIAKLSNLYSSLKV